MYCLQAWLTWVKFVLVSSSLISHKLEAALDLHFEVVDRLKGADISSSSHGIAETIDESALKPGTAFFYSR